MSGIKLNKKLSAIVIGASAGGLYATTALLEILPRDYQLPVIIVQHRSKGHRDLLEEVLQSKCKIRIKQADEKEKIQNNMVYIAPPDYHLLVEKDLTFSLSTDEHVRYSRPSIDVLFQSAAIAYKELLAAIILTGANNDGASGIIEVKQYGGLTIAQDPAEALFPVMPKAAIDTNHVDAILPIASIQKFLLTFSKDKNEAHR